MDTSFFLIEKVALIQGFSLQKPLSGLSQSPQSYWNQTAKHSGLLLRPCQLSPSFWETPNQGPFLGFIEKDNQPIPTAFFPHKGVYYYCQTPLSAPQKLEAKDYTHAHPIVYQLMPAFPLGPKETLSQVMGFILKDIKPILFLAIFFLLLTSLPAVFIYILLQKVVVHSQKENLWHMSMAFGMANMLWLFTDALLTQMIYNPLTRAHLYSQYAFLHRLIHLPLSFLSNYSPFELMHHALAPMRAFEQLKPQILKTLLLCILSIGIIISMLFIHVKIGLFIVMLFILLSFSLFLYYSGLFQAKQKERLGQSLANGFVFEGFLGIHTLKIFGFLKPFMDHFETLQNQFKQAFFAVEKKVSLFYVANFLGQLGIFLAVMLFLYPITEAEISQGTLNALLFLLFLLWGMWFRFAENFTQLLELKPLLASLSPFFQVAPEDNSPVNTKPLWEGPLEVKGVYFRYDPDGVDCLKNIHCRIMPNSMVAFVGPSGSGKSSLLKLLLGLHAPLEGQITFSGHDITQTHKASLRKQCGVVMQNGYLFQGSILDNILGASSLTPQMALKAAMKSGLSQDLKTMPMGIYTLVSEGGANLSQSQQQKILLAKALAKDPPLLILDEATSHLDGATQKEIMSTLKNLPMTRILVTHQAELLSQVDYIYVLKEGQIEEEGTYEALVKKQGLFKSLLSRSA